MCFGLRDNLLAKANDMKKELFEYLKIIVQLQEQLLQLLWGQQQLKAKEEWLDGTDVKNRLNISERTLYRLRTTGQVSARKIGRKWYYAQLPVKKDKI